MFDIGQQRNMMGNVRFWINQHLVYSLLKKVLKTPTTVIPETDFVLAPDADLTVLGKALTERVRSLFNGSLAIREVDAGSSNAEEQELNALTNPYYDIERFGIHFVASPRHADMLFVTGPVSRNMAEAVRRTVEATPTPRIVVAVGDGAINGGIFRDSYAIYNSLRDVVQVDYEIPGDPPSPRAVITGLLTILDAEQAKRLQ
jgi:Ni,Fe-hydrogenase III small subunit